MCCLIRFLATVIGPGEKQNQKKAKQALRTLSLFKKGLK
jgi:hypothetical protein